QRQGCREGQRQRQRVWQVRLEQGKREDGRAADRADQRSEEVPHAGTEGADRRRNRQAVQELRRLRGSAKQNAQLEPKVVTAVPGGSGGDTREGARAAAPVLPPVPSGAAGRKPHR